MMKRALVLACLLLATPALGQNSFPTPGGQTVPGMVTLCPNGASQAVPCQAAASATTVVSALAETSHVLKASPGNLISVYATDIAGPVGMLMIFNATSAPADGAVTPQDCVPLIVNGLASISYGMGSPYEPYTVGITAVVSSGQTCFAKTTNGGMTAFIHGTVQ